MKPILITGLIALALIPAMALGQETEQVPTVDVEFNITIAEITIIGIGILGGLTTAYLGWRKAKSENPDLKFDITAFLDRVIPAVIASGILAVGAAANVIELNLFTMFMIFVASIGGAELWLQSRSKNLKKNNRVNETELPVEEIEGLEEERPPEVPPGKDIPSPLSTGNVNPDKLMFIADRETWNTVPKTINGNTVKLIAIQPSPRTIRKKKNIYVYHIAGTNLIVYNQTKNGVYFMRMAIRPQNVSNYYDVFMRPPLTQKEKEWLERYGYQLVTA